ncbi:MAG TPA: hypothetical protein P5024_12230 [Burkholderiaceae bacterium]|nr:hypothetical protein [Burkholderiaceae bacterium]
MSQALPQDTPPSSSPDKLPPELAGLAADAAELDSIEGAAPGQAPAPAPELTNAAALELGVILFRELAGRLLGVQSLERTLGDREAKAIGQAVGPVADKYGLRLGDFGASVELQAIAVAGPILWAAWRALDDELRAKKAAAASSSSTASGSPGEPAAPAAG